MRCSRRGFVRVTTSGLALVVAATGLVALDALVAPAPAARAAASDATLLSECAKIRTGQNLPSIYTTCSWVVDSVQGAVVQPAEVISDYLWNCSNVNDGMTVVYGTRTDHSFSAGFGVGVSVKTGIDLIVEDAVTVSLHSDFFWGRTDGIDNQLWIQSYFPPYNVGWVEFQPQVVLTTGHFVGTRTVGSGKAAHLVNEVSQEYSLSSTYYLKTGAPAGVVTPKARSMSDAEKTANCPGVNPTRPVLLAQPGDRCATPSADASGSGFTVLEQPVRLLRTCAGVSSQRDVAATWSLEPNANGTFSYQDLASGMCLDTHFGEAAAGTQLVQRYCTGAPTQQWRVAPAGPGSYQTLQNTGTLSSAGGPFCAAVDKGRLVPGSTLVLGSCSDVSAMWSYDRDEAVWGSVTLATPGGTCVVPASQADSAHAVLGACAGTVDQTEAARWYVVSPPSGTGRAWLRSAWSGECLNLWGGATYQSPCSSTTGLSTYSQQARPGGVAAVQNFNGDGGCLGAPGGAWAGGTTVVALPCSALGSDWSVGAPWPQVRLGMPDDRCAVPSTWPATGSYAVPGTPLRMLPQCGATAATTDASRQAATGWYRRQLGGGLVVLQSPVSGLCAGTTNAATTPGTTVNLTACTNPGVTWTDTTTGGSDTYAVPGGTTCLAPSHGSVAAGTTLILDACAARTAWSRTAQPRHVVSLAWADLPYCLRAGADGQLVSTLWGCSGSSAEVTYFAAELQEGADQFARVSNPAQCLTDVGLPVVQQPQGFGSSGGPPERLQSAPCGESDTRQLFFVDDTFTSGRTPGARSLRNVATSSCVRETVGDGNAPAYSGPTLQPCVLHGAGQDWQLAPILRSPSVLALSQDRCAMRDGSTGPGAVGAGSYLDLVTPCAGTTADAAVHFTRYDVANGTLLADDPTGTCLTGAPGVSNVPRMQPCALDPLQVWTATGPAGAQTLSVPAVGPGYTSLCLGGSTAQPRWTLTQPATAQLQMATCSTSAWPAAFQWSFTRQPRTFVTLGQPDDRCLGSTGVLGSRPAMQRPCAGTGTAADTNAQLAVVPVQPGLVQLVSAGATGCLGASAATAGVAVLAQDCGSPASRTVWTAVPVGPATRYQLLGTSLCLTTPAGLLAAGTGAVVDACSGALAWTGRDTTLGPTTVLARSGGRCVLPSGGGLSGYFTVNQLVRTLSLCAPGGAPAAGVAAASTWAMRPLRTATFQLVDQASGLCLETLSGATTPGPAQYLSQGTCSDPAPNQAWTRVPDGPAWRYKLAGTSSCATDASVPGGSSLLFLGACDATAGYQPAYRP